MKTVKIRERRRKGREEEKGEREREGEEDRHDLACNPIVCFY